MKYVMKWENINVMLVRKRSFVQIVAVSFTNIPAVPTITQPSYVLMNPLTRHHLIIQIIIAFAKTNILVMILMMILVVTNQMNLLSVIHLIAVTYSRKHQ